MKLEELQEEIAVIKQKRKALIGEAVERYCIKNKKYVNGDIIEDHHHIILVDGHVFTPGTLDFNPETIYRGKKLRKSDLQPYKSNEISNMWQSNVIKKHGVKDAS